MGKLYDITGFWNMSYDYKFNTNDSWKGSIVLNDDGWFEGFVCNPNNPSEERLIIGVYIPDRGIEVIKIRLNKIENPIIYRCISKNGYCGKYYIIGYMSEFFCGMTNIVLSDVEKNKDNNTKKRNIIKEKEEILKKINRIKNRDEFQRIYNVALTKKLDIINSIMNNYYEGSTKTKRLI